MSIKFTLPLLIAIAVLESCKSSEKPYDKFAKYTQSERDSIASDFNAISDYMAQPTTAHRKYKDSAIILAPQNIEYREVLSYSYKKRGEHIKAMEILNPAVGMGIKKGSKDGLEYLAWSLLYFYRDYEGTVTAIDQITNMSKRNYNICWGEPCGLLKGQALYRLGKYDEAIAVFDTVLTEEARIGFRPEDNFLVHFYKGRSYHSLKKHTEALKSYQTVLNKDQNYTEALYQMGMVYMELGEKNKALPYLEKALHWVKKGKKMGEPYFERFDEVFLWQIDEAMKKINSN